MKKRTIDDLNDQFAVYLEINRGYSKGTVENYHRSVFRLSTWLEARRNVLYIDEITSADLELFLGTLKNPDGTVFEPTTRHTIISGIRQFFRWAVKYKYLAYDISQNIENPKLKEQLPKSLSVEEALKMMNSAQKRKMHERDYLMTSIFLILGVRVSELVGMNLNDIHESKGIIRIRGKGSKERELTFTPKLIQAIDRYKPIRKRILEERNNKDEVALFVNEKHGKRLTRRGVEHIIEQIAQAAGVECNFNVSPHKLRHTCATILYNEGTADLLAISELLGHKDPSTSKIYTKIKQEKMRSVIESNPLNY
ncbi:tyrosine-type recombinase/integrase [Brevibacillus porteri]|uniref:tyrosine-type recombinase/integrase n=1 Tax=Brevibacillus porteri TaxID=2126350 RepID=UPI003D194DD9